MDGSRAVVRVGELEPDAGSRIARGGRRDQLQQVAAGPPIRADRDSPERSVSAARSLLAVAANPRMGGEASRTRASRACETIRSMPVSVLIVDDHPSFRATARLLLESEGFEVVGEAADGAAGLRDARALEPDLVLLDVQLPDIDGFEVAAQLTGGGRADGRPHLEPRRGRLRPPRGGQRRARVRGQGRALGRRAAGPDGARMTAILGAA